MGADQAHTQEREKSMRTESALPQGIYISDDAESRLREKHGEPCKSCGHFVVRQSPILESVLHFCNAAGENEVLGRVLLRLAESGRCDEASPLFEEF